MGKNLISFSLAFSLIIFFLTVALYISVIAHFMFVFFLFVYEFSFKTNTLGFYNFWSNLIQPKLILLGIIYYQTLHY